jgi:DNA-directed RNA polymerase subunit omega
MVRRLGKFLFPMIEELKDEELIHKIGGRFKLSALIQKRLVALNEGTPSAVDHARNNSSATRDRLNIAIQEILLDKIYLNTEGNTPIRYDEGISMVLDTEFTEGY